MPAVRARSGETSAITRGLRARSTNPTIRSAAPRPSSVSRVPGARGAPKSASISSSPEASMLPTASAAEKTTPITASVGTRVLCSIAHTSTVPANSAASPPSTGLTRSATASPIPGSATCERASPASVMRRITANAPTRPAATAMASGSASALGEPLIVEVKAQRRPVHFLEPLGGEDVERRAGTRGPSPREAEHARRVAVHEAQLVGDEEHREVLVALEPVEHGVETFAAGFVDAGGELVAQEHRGRAHEREGEQQALELPAGERADRLRRHLAAEAHELHRALRRGPTAAREGRAGAQKVEARDGQLALEVELLGHVADARPRGPADRALVGDAADQRAKKDGLARAVGADDGERAALRDGDREVVQDLGGTEADGEVLDLEDVPHAATPSRPEPTGRPRGPCGRRRSSARDARGVRGRPERGARPIRRRDTAHAELRKAALIAAALVVLQAPAARGGRQAPCAIRAAPGGGCGDHQLLALEAQRRRVRTQQLPPPPRTRGAVLGARRERVAVVEGEDAPRAPVAERGAGEQPQRRRVGFEEPAHERQQPSAGVRVREGGEPHEPVEAQVVRRDLRRPPPRVAGLALELVLVPARLRSRRAIRSAFEHDLVAHAGDAAEGAVRVDEVERVEAVVHDLLPGEHVADGPPAQHGDRDGGGEDETCVPRGRGYGRRRGTEPRAA